MAFPPKKGALIIGIGKPVDDETDTKEADKHEALKSAVEDFWRAEATRSPEMGIVALKAFFDLCQEDDGSDDETS